MPDPVDVSDRFASPLLPGERERPDAPVMLASTLGWFGDVVSNASATEELRAFG
jgi:hypothetical protein